jgi:pyruvate dehydrogenase E2 component (dihydrolipoyllysine-residue acetyltransferase)
VFGGALAAFAVALALLAGQVSAGKDPALGAGPKVVIAEAPKPRRIIVRKIIERVVVTHVIPAPTAAAAPPAPPAAAATPPAAAPVRSALAPAPVAAAPAPPPAPAPAPVTTHAS